MGKTVAAVGLAAYFALILSLTLLLSIGGSPQLNLIPLGTVINDWRLGGREFVINFVGNIVAFMPFGILIPMVTIQPLRWWHIAILCASTSGMIESGQYLLGRRVADVDDILLNTLGGLIGYAILLGWRRLA